MRGTTCPFHGISKKLALRGQIVSVPDGYLWKEICREKWQKGFSISFLRERNYWQTVISADIALVRDRMISSRITAFDLAIQPRQSDKKLLEFLFVLRFCHLAFARLEGFNLIKQCGLLFQKRACYHRLNRRDARASFQVNFVGEPPVAGG